MSILLFSPLIIQIIIWIIVGSIFGYATNAIIRNKGYQENWFWWGFFFGLIAMLVALSKPEKAESQGTCTNSGGNAGGQTGRQRQSNDLKNMPKKIYIIGAAAVLLLVFVVIESRHDLSGAYYTNEPFLVSDITFFRDGTFNASDSYGILEGKYSKGVGGDTYSLRFTDRNSSSGNPVNDFSASQIVNQYELKAEKIDEGYLRLHVISETDYLAWFGMGSADFYQYGTIEDAVNEAMNQETNEMSALYGAEQVYTDEQLCDMARAYYIEHYNYNPAFVQIDMVEGDIVTIHLFDIVDDHTATCDWYYIDRYTAAGTDFAGREIELMP